MPTTKGATAFTWASGSSTTSGTTNPLETSVSTDYAGAVWATLVQVGTATTGAWIQIQESPDGGTTWYLLPTKLVSFPLAAGTYSVAIAIEPTCKGVQVGYGAQVGGTSSTLTMQLG